jgi:hypothetical protein
VSERSERTGWLSGEDEAVAELARKMGPTCLDIVDVDELVAAIEATGVNDRVAQHRYGQPTVFTLGEAVLAYLQRDRAHQMARLAAQARPPARSGKYAGQALLRCALYLTPVLLAMAAAAPLGRVPWPAPAAALVLGWSCAQALAYAGHAVGAYRGPGPATRVLATGFLTLAAGWSVLLAVVPARLVGGERATAYAITLIELAYFAAVATALVTRSERAVLAWTVPSWLIAAVAIAGRWPPDWPVRIEWLLAGAIALTVWRAFRHLRAPATGTAGARIGPADVVRATAYLLIGLGQALAFVLVWRAAPDGAGGPPAALPLLAAVPLLEIFVGWHTARVAVGLDEYDDHRAYRRHLRVVAFGTIFVLVPPLFTGVAFGAAADRLPLRLSDHPDARALVLALASGVLLAGLFGVVLLLATRRRLGTAALLAAAPATLTAGIAGRDDPAHLTGAAVLPTAVAVLAAVYALGLATATYVLFDPRSYR